MNEVFFPNDPNGALLTIPFRKEWPVSWAGADPIHGGFCFGSENGDIVFTDFEGTFRSLLKSSTAAQPINGIGWSRNYLMTSTRAEIRLTGPWGPNGPGSDSHVLDIGAFGVAVTPQGNFVLPCGRGGWIFFAIDNPHEPIAVGPTQANGRNFYSAAAFVGNAGNELIAFATRQGGVGHTILGSPPAHFALKTAIFDGLDVVDICSLASAQRPHAAIAAAKDGSLILFDDIGSNKKPHIVKFKSVSGTLYRVLSAGGDVYVFTSIAMYRIVGLAHRVLERQTNGKFHFEILRVDIQASDANVVGDKWLLAVGENEVFRFAVQKMPRPNAPRNGAVSARNSDQPNFETAEESEANADWIESAMERRELALSVQPIR